MSTTVEELRALFKASLTKSLPLLGLIPDSVAARLRETVGPLVRPYFVPDRGRYHFDDTHAEPTLFEGLAALAGEIAEVRVTPRRGRWTRMARGDYALYKNDHRLWRDLDRHLEVVLDFSAGLTHEAQIVYTLPDDSFWIAQQPLCGAVVDRRQQIQRYDRYLTHRAGDAEVFRLSLALEVEA